MENKTYFFQPEKKLLKQGFFMTDEDWEGIEDYAMRRVQYRENGTGRTAAG